jgi:hypothetical protein
MHCYVHPTTYCLNPATPTHARSYFAACIMLCVGTAPGEVLVYQLDPDGNRPHISHKRCCACCCFGQFLQHVVHGTAPGEVPADQYDPDGNPTRHLTAEEEEDMDKRHQEATLQVMIV